MNRNRNRLWIASIFLLLGLNACKKDIKYQKSNSGLEYYFFHKSDTGKTGKPGYFYLVDMIGQREDDSVFVNSYTLGQKIKLIRMEPPLSSRLSEALAMVRSGDSLIIKMSADSFFRPLKQPVPRYLKPQEQIRFTMAVKDVLSPTEHLLQMYVFELENMEAYLRKKKWSYLTDKETGIKYEIIKKGDETIAEEGDEAHIAYLMTYMNGKIIDRTKPGDKSVVVIGSPEFMKGIGRMISLASQGAKLQAIIPFSQGFGEEGSAYVAPYSTLVVEMDILKINKKK